VIDAGCIIGLHFLSFLENHYAGKVVKAGTTFNPAPKNKTITKKKQTMLGFCRRPAIMHATMLNQAVRKHQVMFL
jgi:hypothetical protein